MPDIGYLNGHFSALDRIAISPDDRGFLFGDGVYEVIRAYHGIPAFWEDHYSRLTRSAKEIRLALPLNQEQFHHLLVTGVKQSQFSEGKIYIQVTRGVAPREHAFSSSIQPTVFLSFRSMSSLPEELRIKGVSVITVPDCRWGRCDIKSLNLLPNILAKQQAQEAKAFEAIFVREGMVREGATSNIFIVQGNNLLAPERDHSVLSGVTQQQVVNLAHAQGKETHFGQISEQTLFGADEVFLVGTTIEVLPVSKVNGKRIGNGGRGPVTQSLQQAFTDLVGALA